MGDPAERDQDENSEKEGRVITLKRLLQNSAVPMGLESNFPLHPAFRPAAQDFRLDYAAPSTLAFRCFCSPRTSRSFEPVLALAHCNCTFTFNVPSPVTSTGVPFFRYG